MDMPKLPLDHRWMEQELKPYLRCAFSHDLSYHEDITPVIHRALDFCMHKPDHASDGDDLIFERICHAVQFRYKDFASDLYFITESLDVLARMNIASGALREYEAANLERLRQAAEMEEQDGPIFVPDPPPKAAPTEDQIDPRLIHARPGQYVSPNLSGTLTVAEDQYLRNQNRLLEKYRQRNPPVPTWQEQLHQAAAINPPGHHPYHGSNNAWMYGHQSVHKPPPVQSPAPSNAPDFGRRQSPYSTQTMVRGNDTAIAPLDQPIPLHTRQQPFAPTTRMLPPAQPQRPFNSRVTYTSMPPVHQQAYRAPVQAPHDRVPAGYHESQIGPRGMMSADAPARKPAPMTNTHPVTAANIPTADFAHLRGNEWEEAARNRAHEFNMLLKEQKEKRVSEFMQSNGPTNLGLGASPPSRPGGPIQAYSTPVAPMYGTLGRSNGYQAAPQQTQQAYSFQHHQQQPGTQTNSGHGAQSFVRHPNYSNVTSTFPDPNAMYAWSMQKPPENK